MHELKYTNDDIKVVIQYEAALGMMDQPELGPFMLALDELQRAADLKRFDVIHLETLPTDWTYHFETNGGVAWDQLLLMTDPPLSSGTFGLFNVEGAIEQHQVVRRLTVELIKKYQIKKIEVKWE